MNFNSHNSSNDLGAQTDSQEQCDKSIALPAWFFKRPALEGIEILRAQKPDNAINTFKSLKCLRNSSKSKMTLISHYRNELIIENIWEFCFHFFWSLFISIYLAPAVIKSFFLPRNVWRNGQNNEQIARKLNMTANWRDSW